MGNTVRGSRQKAQSARRMTLWIWSTVPLSTVHGRLVVAEKRYIRGLFLRSGTGPLSYSCCRSNAAAFWWSSGHDPKVVGGEVHKDPFVPCSHGVLGRYGERWEIRVQETLGPFHHDPPDLVGAVPVQDTGALLSAQWT